MLSHRWLPLKAGQYLYTVQDVWSLSPNAWQPESFQQKVGARLRIDLLRSDLVIAASETTRIALLAATDIRPERVVMIPNGVTLPDASLLIAAKKLPSAVPKPYVLFVGRLERRKNIPHILNAVRAVSGLHLVLVGEPGHGYDEDVDSAIRTFPADRLTVFDRVDQMTLRALSVHALAALQPSWEEGFGLPILEAMAHGCPVITSNRSACAEIAAGSPLLVDPEDPKQSSLLLERLLSDSDFADAARSFGYSRAARYSWDHAGRALVETYHALAGS